MRNKYIMFDGPLFDYPIIFPENFDHFEMAQKIGHEVISAGFVEFGCFNDNRRVSAQCYGKSVSLKVEARPDDSKILTRFFCEV